MNGLKTFTFFEKNGNAAIYFDATSNEEAEEILAEKTKYPDNWVMEEFDEEFNDN